MNYKGTLTLLILHILAQEACHGYEIAKRIRLLSDDVLDFKEGTLYPTLHKLEKEGVLAAFSEVENGRKRRYYRLTDAGRAQLAQERSNWQTFSQAVTAVLGESA